MACPESLIPGDTMVVLILGVVVFPGDVLEALASDCPLLDELVDLEVNSSARGEFIHVQVNT